jgi:hypothetical protein
VSYSDETHSGLCLYARKPQPRTSHPKSSTLSHHLVYGLARICYFIQACYMFCHSHARPTDRVGNIWPRTRFPRLLVCCNEVCASVARRGTGRSSTDQWILQFTCSFRPHYGLGSTQPLADMSTTNLPGDAGRPASGADLTAICAPTV